MKSKNPKNIKKGMCILIAVIVIITTLIYAIGSYRSDKLAIAKAKNQEGLLTVKLKEVEKEGSNFKKIVTNQEVTIKDETDIRYVKLVKDRRRHLLRF